MFWQSKGAYLAVKVDHYTKGKKSTYMRLQLFRIKERDIPVEVLNFGHIVADFAWEPKGHRFVVVLQGDSLLPDVVVYSMLSVDRTACISKLVTLESRQVSGIYWAPKGRYMLLAGLQGFNGQLEFFDSKELRTLQTAEHLMANSVQWDFTGR